MGANDDFHKKEIDEKTKISNIYNQTLNDLKTEERFVNFFKTYNAQSVQNFSTYYASQKANWYKYADSIQKNLKSKKNRWRNTAVECLIFILKKKLFNLKCRWVAGEMDLPHIESSYDFQSLLYDLNKAAEVLEPINQKELLCFIDYYQNEDAKFNSYEGNILLDHYHKYKVTDLRPETGLTDDYPTFYKIYDSTFDTGHLLELPLLRMELESDYVHIYTKEIQWHTFNENQKKYIVLLDRKQRNELRSDAEKLKAHFEHLKAINQEREKNQVKYESISVYERDKMAKLVAQIETKEIQQYYKSVKEWDKRREFTEQIEMDKIILKEAKQWVPIEANTDYRKAIKSAFKSYEKKMTLETLPLIYEEYLSCVTNKKPFDWKTSEYESTRNYSTEFNSHILQARKLLGEPENFDFLKKENLPS